MSRISTQMAQEKLKFKDKHQTKLKKISLSEKWWKHNYPGTCDSPNKLFSRRRDLLLSNTATAALALSASHIYSARRTRVQGLPVHMRDALKNKPSFGQSGFRWFGYSSKASSSLGQLIISMDARHWCSQVWRTSIKRPGSLAHGSRLQSHLSGDWGFDHSLSYPKVLCKRSTVLQRIITMKKKKSKLNSAVARESQIWSRPKKEGKERKIAERCQVFAGTRGRKDRCLIFFSVQEAGP